MKPAEQTMTTSLIVTRCFRLPFNELAKYITCKNPTQYTCVNYYVRMCTCTRATEQTQSLGFPLLKMPDEFCKKIICNGHMTAEKFLTKSTDNTTFKRAPLIQIVDRLIKSPSTTSAGLHCSNSTSK
jgi:hypothetical protein